MHEIGHGGRRRDDVQIEFALDALLDDLHMQQAQKAAAESEPERDGVVRLERERGVVELELKDCLFEIAELAPVQRIDPAKDHGLYLLISGKRRRCGAVGKGDVQRGREHVAAV